MKVHNDPPEKNTRRSYERFLVNSPLQVKSDFENMLINLFGFFLLFIILNEQDKIGIC